MISNPNMSSLVDEIQLMDTEKYELAVEQVAEVLPTIYQQLGMGDSMDEMFSGMEKTILSRNDSISTFKRQSVEMFISDVRNRIIKGV